MSLIAIGPPADFLSVCLCVEAGVLTPASLTELNTQVTANSGLLAPILNLVGGLTGAVTRLASNLLPTVSTSA